MTVRSSVISFTVRVFGTFTSMPDCNIGAVTMKMISSTSTTSTSGVTLMSASELCVFPLLPVKAITISVVTRAGLRACRTALDQVHHLQREVVHSRPKLPDLAQEIVVGNHRRNRREQTCGRCDQ